MIKSFKTCRQFPYQFWDQLCKSSQSRSDQQANYKNCLPLCSGYTRLSLIVLESYLVAREKHNRFFSPAPSLRDCWKCLASRRSRARNTYRIVLAQLNAIASNESWLSCYISHHEDSIEAPESKARHQCSPCGVRKGQRRVNKLRALAKSETKYSGIVPRGPFWDPDVPGAYPLP